MKRMIIKRIMLIILAIGFGNSLVIAQERQNNRQSYSDSIKSEWWFPFVEKYTIELHDFLDYDKVPLNENMFINGKLELENDTVKIFKNGIALEKKKDMYSVYYFDVFQIDTVDYELTGKIIEDYSLDSLLLLKTEQYEGKHFWIRSDRKKELVYMKITDIP